ncbi:MAG TPA: choice-of-anchor D domain-containing protein [Ignavibacteriaceae bacterium]|nr:choice-of-anchor D domain-containing protein [Ignavibacteriaceae bacterium]
MKKFFLLFFTLILSTGFVGEVWGQVSFTSVGQTITQNFNSLANSGTSNTWTDNTTIVGWYSNRTAYIGNDGSSTTGGLHSYGSTSSTERALGGLSSGSATPVFGVRLKNTSGATLTSFDVSFKGEQWRQTANSQILTFEYLVGAISLSSGTWTSVSALDFTALKTGTAGTLDGNASGNFSNKSTTITVSVSNNDEIWFRWTKSGSTSPGLAIDDFSVTGNGVVISSSSDIIANTSFTYPTNIAYGSYQGTTLTDANSVEVAKFDIRDGGGSADADALSTTLTAIGFNVTGHANLRRIALFDGTTNIGEVAAGATASFSSLSLAAADGGSKTFSVRVSFLASVTDNQNFSFTVNSATASGAGSGFAAAAAGGAASSTTGDNNKIEVTATDIIFDDQVSTVSMGAVMSPAPTLHAVDANVNLDLDYNAAWTVAVSEGSTTFDGSATTSGNFSAGIATLSNLKFDKAGENNKITVTSGIFSDESAAFEVTDPQPEINVKVVDENYLNESTYAFGNQVSGTSSSVITFTIENLGTKELSLTGTPIVEVTGTNAADFSVDVSSTNATVPISDNTTFTVTFSPSSQGSKIAQLSIDNDDATGDENPYLINLTGTGTVSSSSDIVTTSGYSHTSNIAYASYQSAATLTTENSVGVNGLTIRDGAASADDADNLGTTLTAISFSTGGSTAIRTAALFDGSTNVKEVAVNGGTTIAFTELTLAASDNSSKNFELRVTFLSTVTDNQQITFTVSSATASSSGSNFATGNAGAAASSTTGDINRIEVTATKLAFVQGPSTTIIDANMSPAVTVSANDALDNRDLDFATEVNITSSGTLNSTPKTSSAASGVATFSTINHTASGTALTLSANSTGLTGATSGTFDITIQPAGVLLLEENFNYTGSLTDNNWTAHSSGGTNPLTTTTGLSYSGYSSSNIGNAVQISNLGGEDLNVGFDAQNTNSSSVYFSFLANLSEPLSSKTGDYFFNSGTRVSSTSFSSFAVRVFARIVSDNVNFGISNTSTSTYGSTNFSKNTTYLLIIKYTINTGGNDEVKLWVLNSGTPSSETGAGTPEVTNSSTAGTDIIDAIALRQGSATTSPTIIIDGIRVATNWGSLMGSPQYNSATNLGGGNYNSLTVQSGGEVTLTGSANISGTLNLNGGTINVGNNVLTVSSITGGSASSYIKTTGSGGLKRNVPTTESGTLFPVGTESSYNPVTITNSGTADNFTVSVKGTFDNAPVDINKVVNRQWSISEDTPGGSNAIIKLQWNTAEEAGSFVRTNAVYVGHYTGGTWQQTAATYTDLGSGVYSAEASGFTSFSPFGIGNENALPVELASFNAVPVNGAVKLNWQTSTEINNHGFDVERAIFSNSSDDLTWETLAFVKGNGNSNSVKEYSYTDNNISASGKYAYRLKQLDTDGAYKYSPIVETDITVVLDYALEQNYPNPFNPSTTINYSIPNAEYVTIKVFNTLGEEVATLFNGNMEAGKHSLSFDASKLSSGMYIYRLSAGNFTQIKKMLLAK